MIGFTLLLPLVTAAILVSLGISRQPDSGRPAARAPRPREAGPSRLELRIAVLGALSTLASTLALLLALETAARTPASLVERHDWAAGLGVSATFRIDGINVFPLLATALLSLVAILSSRSRAMERGRLFLVVTLALETSLFGVFTAQDAVLLVIFLQSAILCVYSLLLAWGATPSRAALSSNATRVVLWLSAAAAGILLMVLHVHGSFIRSVPTADLVELAGALRATEVEPALRWEVFFLGVTGCATLLPLFPLHRWLAGAQRGSSAPAEILLVGLLGAGVFSFVRIALPLVPGAADVAPWLVAPAVLSVLVAAVGSLLESDAKGLVYRFSLAHLGLALAGVLTLTVEGVVGGLVLLVSHSLAATALYLLLDTLGQRGLSQRIGDTRALGRRMPRYGRVLLLVAGCAAGVLPASSFAGVYLVACGLLEAGRWGAATLAVAGVLIVAASLIAFCSRLLFPFERTGASPAGGAAATSAPDDLQARELATVLPLALAMVAGGVFSTWFTDRMTPTVQEWLQAIR